MKMFNKYNVAVQALNDLATDVGTELSAFFANVEDDELRSVGQYVTSAIDVRVAEEILRRAMAQRKSERKPKKPDWPL
jgi:hypothetical protein